MRNEKYDRNMRFFGREGQGRLASASVAVVGIGGLGTHVVQQLALLGVGQLTLIDDEETDETNHNRYVGLRYDDPVPGTLKVANGERIALTVNPDIEIVSIPEPLASSRAFEGVIDCDYVFGCLDNEGARLILTELCAAYSKPYFDLASDILVEDNRYGGRVCVAWDGNGCLVCYDELDVVAAREDLMDPHARRDHQDIYGVPRDALGEVGPSVVSINGVVASLGVTEFMLVATQVRDVPRGLSTYRAHAGIVSVAGDDPSPDCYYCYGIRGKGPETDVWRYARVTHTVSGPPGPDPVTLGTK